METIDAAGIGEYTGDRLASGIPSNLLMKICIVKMGSKVRDDGNCGAAWESYLKEGGNHAEC
jgi:hypothetical protein